MPDPITTIRTRVACHLEAAAEALEQLQPPTPDQQCRAAYEQGRADGITQGRHDERQRILSHLKTWHDALPLGRSFDRLRVTLHDLCITLEP